MKPLLASLLALPLLAQPLLATPGDPPGLLHLQARLADSVGTPLAGPVSFEARVYDAAVGGTLLWSESHAATALNGVVSVLLGGSTPFPTTLFDGTADLYFTLEVEGDGEMLPRRRVAAVAFAQMAKTAATADSAAEADSLAPGATLPNDSVSAATIQAGAVGNSEIQGDAVTAGKIASNAVGTSEIATNAVGTAEIAPDAVTSTELAAGAVTTDAIATKAVDGGKIAPDAVGSVHIAAGAVDASHIGTDVINSSHIGLNAVDSAELAVSAVNGGHVLDNSLTAADLANNTITGAKIASSTIDAGHLAANSVGSSEIASGAVGSSEIADGSITAADIGTEAVGELEIAANAVKSAELGNGVVLDAHIASSADIAGTKIDAHFGNQDITTNYDLGIGTTSPTADIHIASGGSVSMLLEADTNGSGAADQPQVTFSQDGGLTQARMGFFGATNDFEIIHDDPYDLHLGTAGLRRLTVNGAGGWLGVNTATPLATIHAVGEANLGSLMIAPNEATSGDDSELYLTEDDDGSFGMKLRYDGGTNQMEIWSSVSGTDTGPYFEMSRSTGDVVFSQDVTVEGTINGTGTPFAYGTVDSFGNKTGGSDGWGVLWDSGQDEFRITFTGMFDFDFSNYAMIVTPTDGGVVAVPQTNDGGVNRCDVKFWTLAGVAFPTEFSFVLYKY